MALILWWSGWVFFLGGRDAGLASGIIRSGYYNAGLGKVSCEEGLCTFVVPATRAVARKVCGAPALWLLG